MTDSRQQQDYMADVYEQVDRALVAALFRPLTEDEVGIIRYAAGVSERMPAMNWTRNQATQPDIWEI